RSATRGPHALSSRTSSPWSVYWYCAFPERPPARTSCTAWKKAGAPGTPATPRRSRAITWSTNWLGKSEHRRDAVLRDREDHGDRLELGDDDQAARIGRMHDVAGVHQTQPHAAGDGRGDATVGELNLRGLDLALVVLDRALELVNERCLRVVLLPRHRVLLDEHLVSLEIE